MEFLPSKKNTNSLNKIINKMDIKNVRYNTVKELPVTWEEIRFKAKFNKFITKNRNEIMDPKKNKGNNIFLCVTVYCYMEIGW